MSQRRIPTVKLSHYTRGTGQERDRFIKTWGDALKEFGFVTVEDHGIPDAMIRRAYAATEAFFHLPTEAKTKYAIEGAAGQRGYTGFGKEHAKNRTVGDLKEFWHVGRDFPAGKAPAHYVDNVWPTEIADFRPATMELFTALDETAAIMLHALADYFEVKTDTFSKMRDGGNSILRLIHYPPLKDLFVPGGVRAAEHEDINLITLLCEGTSSGLELLTRQGEWMSVDTLRGQIVVDSGDMLERVTNDVTPATTHRVVNPREEDKERYSMPFFCHPYPECVLQPLPSLETAENPAKYEPITADAFLRQRLEEIGLLKKM